MSTVKVHIDLRSRFVKVGNQGRRPTCLAFAASDAHVYLHKCTHPLCVEWLYYHAVSNAGDPPDAGSTLPSTQHVLKKMGQPHELHWPYEVTPIDQTSWRPPAKKPSDLYYAESITSPSFSEITEALEASQPSIIALNIGSAFQTWANVSGEAVITDESEHPSQGAGHALLAVGHGVYKTTPHLLIRNSWGASWGESGYAWISEFHMKDRWMGGFRLKEI